MSWAKLTRELVDFDYLEGHTHADSLITDELRNTLNNADIQTAWDGLVVPVAPGLGASDAINPATTTTPIADAITKVDNAPEWGGILLPPEPVEDATAGGLTGLANNKFVKGWGYNASEIQFTDLDSDGAVVSGGDSYWHGFRLSGSDEANRTAGSAIRFSDGAGNFNVGQIALTHWGGGDPVVHFDQGAPWQSHWQEITISNSDGKGILCQNAGAPFTMGAFSYYPNTEADAMRVNGAGLQVQIDLMNLGGEVNRAIEHSDTAAGSLQIGAMNYEPATDPTATRPIITSDGSRFYIGDLVLNPISTNFTVDAGVDMTGGNKHVGRVRVPTGVTVNNAPVQSRGQTGPQIYEGVSNASINQSGGALSPGVACLGDLTLVT